ncbi:MAG TPA: hypothetical protein VFS11_05005 [Gemmatimonadales bacterium]|nr:hypothetical protein [Gemmatimonadales bacterium]
MRPTDGMVPRRDFIAWLAAAGFLAACGRVAREPRPGPLALGQDECAYCRMTIDDAHLAAQFVMPDGRVHKFGEPGCLVAWLRRQGRPAGSAFVADAESARWLAAPAAVYVHGRRRTPMLYNVAAFAQRPADSPPDRVLTWDALLARGVTNAPGS